MANIARRARTARHSPDNREARSMTAPWIVRPARGDDFSHWLVLWRAYCASLDHAVSDEISNSVWSRILDPSEPIWCIFVSEAGDEPQGFANYVLHPHTWSLTPA